MKYVWFSLITIFFLSGCGQSTSSVSPQVTIPSSYKEEGTWKKATPNDNVARGAWWEMYGDTTLNGLMQELAQCNLSIAKYEALYRQALALSESSDRKSVV